MVIFWGEGAGLWAGNESLALLFCGLTREFSNLRLFGLGWFAQILSQTHFEKLYFFDFELALVF